MKSKRAKEHISMHQRYLKGADPEDKHKDDIIYFLTNNEFKS